jgi:drug/metabolite transporter (DMT)-like permease
MLRLGLGAFLISLSPVFVKLAHGPPDVSAFYRMFFGGLGLWLGVRLRGAELLPPPKARPAALACALFFGLDLMCWHRSVLFIGPGLATVLGNFQAFLLAAHGVLVLKERPGPRFLLALPLALAGLGLMVGPQWSQAPGDYRLGVGFGLLTAVWYAGFLLSLKRAAVRGGNPDPMSVMAVVSLGSALFLGLEAAATGQSFAIPDAQSWAALLAYGLLGRVLGWVLITTAMKTARAALVGLLLLAQPALACVWDVLFFQKPFTGLEVTGVAVALAAIFLGATARGGRGA